MITWANAERQACEVDCRRATIYGDGMLSANKRCECLFELGDLRALCQKITSKAIDNCLDIALVNALSTI